MRMFIFVQSFFSKGFGGFLKNNFSKGFVQFLENIFPFQEPLLRISRASVMRMGLLPFFFSP